MKLTLYILLSSLFAFQAVGQDNSTASVNTSNKQLNTENNTDDIDWANFELELTDVNDEWTFHTDQDLRLLYIDFEALGGKMSHLVIKSNNNTILMEEDHLFDLPANTIYEVNLQKLEKGSYFVELHTFTDDVIKEEIQLQK
ncbi:MAG: hypothetical protein GY810_22205 [Aureispira sp.]|nr:hypothetical protein [Aureispira sp.]